MPRQEQAHDDSQYEEAKVHRDTSVASGPTSPTRAAAGETGIRHGIGPKIGRVRMRSAMLRLLARIVASSSDRGLERRFGSRVGQRALFGGMVRSFVPEAADGFAGELQYELARP